MEEALLFQHSLTLKHEKPFNIHPSDIEKWCIHTFKCNTVLTIVKRSIVTYVCHGVSSLSLSWNGLLFYNWCDSTVSHVGLPWINWPVLELCTILHIPVIYVTDSVLVEVSWCNVYLSCLTSWFVFKAQYF